MSQPVRPDGSRQDPAMPALLHRSLTAILIAACLVAKLAAADAPKVEGGSAEEKAAGMTWTFTPDPALPDVLILGDSISIGYTLLVRAELKGAANVFRPMYENSKGTVNCADTATGVAKLDGWLGDRHWRVIHFNFGLHDVKYLDGTGAYVTPDKGTQVASLAVYEANLRTLVARLKATGARLVWGSTTPVPDGSAGRVKGDEVAYNAVAKKVMEENGVAIDDLCACVAPRIAELQKPRNVHFTDEGSKLLAHAVAVSIRAGLAQP
jgi:hypothetical protein